MTDTTRFFICFLVRSHTIIFIRTLRDSTPRFVRPLVGWLVGRLVGRSPFYFFYLFYFFDLTAPAQMV